MVLRYRLAIIALAYSVACPSVYGGAAEYRQLLDAHPDPADKAAICFRFWDISAAIFELMLRDGMRERDDATTNKGASALYQSRLRTFFIESLGRKELVDRGYKAGAGIELSEGLGKFGCKDAVNNLLNEQRYEALLREADERAINYVKTVPFEEPRP